VVADHEAQDGVAEELEALVGGAPVLRAPGTVPQRVVGEFGVGEDVAQALGQGVCVVDRARRDQSRPTT
jgi:hypothetical protein